jgi:hypothetical protein
LALNWSRPILPDRYDNYRSSHSGQQEKQLSAPPEGLGYADAARVVAGLVAGARRLGRSGVDLKDTSRADELAASAALTLE